MRIDLRQVKQTVGLADQDEFKITLQAHEHSLSSHLMRLKPVSGIPEKFIFETSNSFEIHSVAHACDWLKGNAKIILEAETLILTDRPSETDLKNAWNAYLNSKRVPTNLRDKKMKSLLQAFVILTEMPVAAVAFIGGNDKILQTFFNTTDNSVQLAEIASEGAFYEYLIQNAHQEKKTETFNLEAQR